MKAKSFGFLHSADSMKFGVPSLINSSWLRSWIASLSISMSLLGLATPETVFAHDAGFERVGGFVKISPDRELFVDYIKPAPGRPIAVLLNGLTYRIGVWDPFVRALRSQGIGILRYDMFGQGETLLKYAPILNTIPLQDQVDDLANLLRTLGIAQPVHLVSLSYGGGVSLSFSIQHPELVKTQILMAPFVAPIRKQDEWIKLQVHHSRAMNPANPASDDELYDFFLRQLVYSTFPLAEPIILENPFKLEATFRMVQGARRFRARDIAASLPAGTVHLVVARNDQYVETVAHDEFWSQVSNTAKASRLYIDSTEHKIPEVVPVFAANWVRLIIEGDKRISGGSTFEGNPREGTARSTDGEVIDRLNDLND